ncbi:MAG: winged helix-turn-helix transcriptional regulator [Planctomycetota bacterium]
MTRRTYAQRWALAHALDVVGERWTLLLIRELLTGPRRYGELLANLPGMGTNLLAARLKDLAAAGLIDKDEGTYALTARGAALEPAVLALARWGAPMLAEADEDEHWSATWNVVALKYSFRPDRARRARGVLEYRVDGTRVQARVRDGEIETSLEPRWDADVVLEADGETLLAIAGGTLDPDDAEADGALRVDGDRRLYRSSLRFFALG